MHKTLFEEIRTGVHLRRPHPEGFKRMLQFANLLKKDLDEDEIEKKTGINQRIYEKCKQIWIKNFLTVNQFRAYSSINYSKNRPVIGKKNALVLLVNFKDKASTTKKEEFRELLFDDKKKSMKNYFLENSGGKLKIDGEVFGWFNAKNNYASYVDSDNMNNDTLGWRMPKTTELVKEIVIDAQKNSEMDFSQFDNKKNGRIDLLIVVCAGEGSNRTLNYNDISPHRNELQEPIQLEDGLILDNYIINNEIPAFDLGGYCHEIGHSLGLPDLYLPNMSSNVVGKWCLMAGGNYNDDGKTPGHLSAWCKMNLGWAEPIIIKESPRKYEIPAFNVGSKIYKLVIPSSEDREYFLVENRRQKSFDEHIPGEGLLIWHINTKNCKDKKFPNINPESLFLRLIQADGKNDLEKPLFKLKDSEKLRPTEDDVKKFLEVQGDSGDVFPGETGNRMFNDGTNPGSSASTGKKSGIIIESISNPGDVMYAMMGIDAQSVEKYYSDNFLEGYKKGYPDGYKIIRNKNHLQ